MAFKYPLVRRPGRVRRYLLHKYGKKAFNPDGTIKLSYLFRALKECTNESLKKAIRLAILFKTKWRRHRKDY